MAAEDEGKTEEPTSKRLGEAREKGSIARFQDLQQATTLLAGCLALHWAGAYMTGSLKSVMVECFRAIPTWRPGSDDLTSWLMPSAGLLVQVLLPVILPVMFASLALSIWSNGLMFNPGLVVPDITKAFRFSLAKLFGGRALVEVGKARSEERRVGKECRSRWSP